MKLSNILLWIILLAFIGWTAYTEFGKPLVNLGATSNSNITLAGSETAFARMPLDMVFAASTTTDPDLDQGGGVVTQQVYTANADGIRVNMNAKGGTATSTLSFRLQGSMDGTTYWDYQPFDSAYTTTTSDVIATSTIVAGATVYDYDPGVATSSRSIYLPVRGFNFLRFIFLGEDISTDPEDYVKAHVEVNLVEQF